MTAQRDFTYVCILNVSILQMHNGLYVLYGGDNLNSIYSLCFFCKMRKELRSVCVKGMSTQTQMEVGNGIEREQRS